MKLLHCGDFHFNRPLTCLDSEKIAAIRREEHFEAFRKAAKMAEDCDAMLISGDLFDNTHYDPKLTEKLMDCLKAVPRVFIAPGNHDPYSVDSVYDKFAFPDNVYVFRGETEAVDCGEFAVYGNCGCPIGDVNPDNSKINILCIHAMINGNGEYNSISEGELCSYGFDYAALGHIHKYSGVAKRDKSSWAYCGAPFSGGFDETGDKGVLFGTVTKDSVDMTLVKTDKRAFHEETVILDNAENYENIVLSEPLDGDFYKITVTGTVSENFLFRPDVLRERIADKYYYVKVKDKTHVHVSYEAMSEEYTLKGIFVKKMLDKINAEPDREELKKALEIGVRVLDGKRPEVLL